MIGDDRAQNELIGTMLTMALVILAVSLVGVVLFTQQGQQASRSSARPNSIPRSTRRH